MKLRILAAALFLLGIICLAHQPRAQLTMTGVGGGFGASGGASPASYVPKFADSQTITSSVYTTPSINFGSGTIVLGCFQIQGATVSISTVTVNGVTATAIPATAIGSGGPYGGMYYATGVSGTGTVVVTSTGGLFTSIACVGGLLTTTTPTTIIASNYNFDGGADPRQFPALSSAIPTNGVGVAFAFINALTSSPYPEIWTNATRQAANEFGISGGQWTIGASSTTAGTWNSTPNSPTAAGTVSTSSVGYQEVYAVWGP